MSTKRKPARRALYHAVLGEHLRMLREERDMPLSRVARRFDVSMALLSKVERGTRGASPASLSLYCEVLDVPLLELLADVAVRHREAVDPFDPLLRVQVPPHLRALDGLAAYAGIPGRHLSEVFHDHQHTSE